MLRSNKKTISSVTTNMSENKSKFYVIIIMILNLAFRLVIYYNTKLFYFHDYKAYLVGIDKIHTSGSIPLIQGNFMYLNSYIGYFFKYIIGSFNCYFIFLAILAVMTSFIIYKIVITVTKNKLAGIFTLILHLI